MHHLPHYPYRVIPYDIGKGVYEFDSLNVATVEFTLTPLNALGIDDLCDSRTLLVIGSATTLPNLSPRRITFYHK